MSKTKAEIQREYNKRTGYASQERYHKEHTISVAIRLMKNTEKDIIEQLEKQSNKAGYIKRLIREDIERSKK